MPLTGKVAIVAGGGHGLGLAVSRRFARDGAKLVIADVDEAAGQSAEKELTAKGAVARFVYCDVADRLDVHNLIAAALEAFDRIDVLVDAAGAADAGGFLSLKEDAFDAVMRVNVKGAFLTAQAAARQMAAQAKAEGAGGRLDRPRYAIVTVGACAPRADADDRIAWHASRGAVEQMTKALAAALSPQGIRVNAICPGAAAAGRTADADDVAALAAFLASEDSGAMSGHLVSASARAR